jgi:hypothetical protein
MIVSQVSRDPQRSLVEHVAALTGIPVGDVEARVHEFAAQRE